MCVLNKQKCLLKISASVIAEQHRSRERKGYGIFFFIKYCYKYIRYIVFAYPQLNRSDLDQGQCGKQL